MPENTPDLAPRCEAPGRAKGSRCTEPAVYSVGPDPGVLVCAGHVPWGVKTARALPGARSA